MSRKAFDVRRGRLHDERERTCSEITNTILPKNVPQLIGDDFDGQHQFDETKAKENGDVREVIRGIDENVVSDIIGRDHFHQLLLNG